jgi:hypothetical protein
MVPRTPILHGSPGIIEIVSRSDRTLSHAIDAVHVLSFYKHMSRQKLEAGILAIVWLSPTLPLKEEQTNLP